MNSNTIGQFVNICYLGDNIFDLKLRYVIHLLYAKNAMHYLFTMNAIFAAEFAFLLVLV